ncbi:HAUS augmin-like complex subunit 4-domain-containing protein [Mortierella sp. GBAus27b]|nr:HAUS augmin-like complex subunit 4-domain-containing protein [Mortierella sp. GBAus27b]
MMDTIMDLIRQRAQDVVAHVDHSSTEHTIGEQKRRHHVLPVERSFADVISHTKEDVSLLDRIKEKVMLQELTIHNQVLELFDTLHQTILVLWEILTEFMVRYQLERDQTFKEYFAQVIDSLVLKLEVLKGSLQQEVYDKDTNRRLSQVRDTLERMQQNLEAQTKHNVALLQQYKGAGQEFNMIVDAYTKIMYRIEVVQDDVQRLSLDMK